jgi:hypothetical protein
VWLTDVMAGPVRSVLQARRGWMPKASPDRQEKKANRASAGLLVHQVHPERRERLDLLAGMESMARTALLANRATSVRKDPEARAGLQGSTRQYRRRGGWYRCETPTRS